MLNRLRSVFTHHQFMRRGNTLLITLMTVVLVVGLVGLSSEHVSSDVKLEKLNVDRQRAQRGAVLKRLQIVIPSREGKPLAFLTHHV